MTLCAASATAGDHARAATQAELTGQSQLLAAVNGARTDRGLPPLRLSKVLSRPARQHSAYLASSGRLDHDGADGSPFYVRLYRAGFSRYRAVGENLGMSSGCNTRLSSAMVDLWLASGGHRRNLLSKRFTVVGIAVVTAADCSSTVYTTDFGA